MEVITIESAAYKELTAKLDLIAGYISKAMIKKKAKADMWLSGKELTALLGVSPRTLQRMRDNNSINYAIFRGACRYHISEVERLIAESLYTCDPTTLEEFKRNYGLRTRGKKRR
ncbi:hypothetical protein BN938_2698 [Mucinivorans hirudinis]|uniref:Helix-turn-helix domain-containing protein n=1 Tax=Mucinivorans hirudinis TaxID=1433126 RepID=A0A060RAZ0_9BACT|nr:hypothetical protein BN938_0326 [Mucinivorans hirudinis]CDN30708.1 hypothetical protein BN938_0603 [Mucinivorans hirudinis]CDN32767.1 hypothetical protein BN938_2698 [Mucinivorans hirudinis]